MPDRPRLEDYAARYPAFGPIDQLPEDLVGDEYRIRRVWNDRPQHEEYVRRFGRWHPRIAEVLARIDQGFPVQIGRKPVPESGSLQILLQDRDRAPPVDTGAAERMRVRLEVITGPSQSQSFTFHGHQSFLVGRSHRAHLQLPIADRYFSRVHLMIEMNPPCCRLCDMGSTNGTKLNGRRVQSADLCDGDLIQGGDTTLKISLLGNWKDSMSSVQPPLDQADGSPPRDSGTSQCSTTLSYHSQAGLVASVPLPTATPQAEAGTKREFPAIPNYAIVRELGRGGMGIVYLAQCERSGMAVAIKTIRPAVAVSQAETAIFLREATILQRLCHPKIVRFRESGQVGASLLHHGLRRWNHASQIIKKEGPLQVKRAVGLLCDAIEALQYAHQEGFVHRDVKPGNLLVEGAAGNETCKLADFGLARAYHASSLSGLTMMGDVGGTIPYMPPEQITDYRSAKPSADQYAAAATLYHLLTGAHVFDFDKIPNQERLAKVLCDDPVPIRDRRPDIPRELAHAIHRALAKEPDDRFADVAALGEALAAGAG